MPSWIAVIAGLMLLLWGANRFIDGSSAVARNLGVPPLIIGLTIVGLGTSFPEMLISGMAAWQGNTGLSIGNAVGSNIANLGLVLGATAIIIPLQIHSKTLRREFPVMFLVMILAMVLLADGELGRMDGLILLIGFAFMVVWVIHLGRSTQKADPLVDEYVHQMPQTMSTLRAVGLAVGGLLILLVSSRLLVWGAVDIARSFGISDLVIGLTIVAVGTSLPELAASIISAVKGETDIAIGNVIGSNMFNLLPVLALPGLISPGLIDPAVLTRDYPVMLGLSIAVFFMALGMRGPGWINRAEGGLLLAAFCGYQWLLFLTIGSLD